MGDRGALLPLAGSSERMMTAANLRDLVLWLVFPESKPPPRCVEVGVRPKRGRRCIALVVATGLPDVELASAHMLPGLRPGWTPFRCSPSKSKLRSCFPHIMQYSRRRQAPVQAAAVDRDGLPPREYYVLSAGELRAHGYPPHPDGSEADFADTASWDGAAEEGAAVHELLAVDCEMCLTRRGSVLARVCVLSETGEVLMDALVKPPEPIVDYVTAYSGITAEMLAGCTTSLEDVQRRLRRLMDRGTILVGHSLECDLRALRLVHRRCVDTAILYPHADGSSRKAPLRALAHNLLKRTIQAGGTGHDPGEDARAALELALLKFRNGPRFGSAFGSHVAASLLGDLEGPSAASDAAAGAPPPPRCSTALVASRHRLAKLTAQRTHAILAENDSEAATRAAKCIRNLAHEPDALPCVVAAEFCGGNTPQGAVDAAEGLLARIRGAETAATAVQEEAALERQKAKRRRKRSAREADTADSDAGPPVKARRQPGVPAAAAAAASNAPPRAGALWIQERARAAGEQVRRVWDALPAQSALIVVLQGPATLASVLDRMSLSTGLPWGEKNGTGSAQERMESSLARRFRSKGEALVLFPPLQASAYAGKLCVLLKH